MPEPIHIVYHGHDRKLCQVEIDGRWLGGELRAWIRDEHGQWSAEVAWSTGPGESARLDRFGAGRVRAAPTLLPPGETV